MRNEPFDNLIREKLAELRLPYRAADWSLMAQRLDQAFDAAIHRKLSSHTESYHPSAWTEMSTRLDEAFDRSIKARLQHLCDQETPATFWPVMAALLSGQPFEAQVAQKLLTLKLQAEVPEWEAMLQRLEDDAFVSYLRQQLDGLHITEPSSEWSAMQEDLYQQFDQSLGQKLDNLEEASPSEADWQALEAALPHGTFDQSLRLKLEEWEPQATFSIQAEDWQRINNELDAPFDRALRSQLAGHSLARETPHWGHMSALLDAQQPRLSRRWTWRRSVAVAASFLVFLMAGLWWRTADPGLLAPFRLKIFPASPALSQTEAVPPTDEEALPDLSLSGDSQPPNTLSPQVASAAATPSATIQRIHQPERESAQLPPLPAPEEALPVVVSAPATSPESDPFVASTSVRVDQVQPLRRLPNSLANFQLGQKRTMEMLLPPDEYPAEVKLGLVGAFTHTRAELSGPRAEPGYQMGLRVELGLNQHWQLITGVSYGEKNFNHEYHVLHRDRPVRTVLEASMRMVELPLLMRYRFPSEDNLTLYAQAGIVAMLSLEETYQHYDPVTPIPVNANRLPAMPEQLQPEERAWNLITYPGNVLVGLGLEYQATSTLSIQLEPFFLQSLQRTKGSGSLGLEKKLYNTGLNLGVVFDLNAE